MNGATRADSLNPLDIAKNFEVHVLTPTIPTADDHSVRNAAS